MQFIHKIRPRLLINLPAMIIYVLQLDSEQNGAYTCTGPVLVFELVDRFRSMLKLKKHEESLIYKVDYSLLNTILYQ